MEEPEISSNKSTKVEEQSLRDFIERADGKSFVFDTKVGTMNDFLDVQLYEGDSVKAEVVTEISNVNASYTPKDGIITEDSYDRQDDDSWIDSGGEESFSVSCGLCSFRGKDTLSIINHMNNHRFRTNACCICALVLGSSDELGRHLATHKKEVPYTCSYCNHGFFRLSSLHSHHCSKKPTLLCQHCGEPFRFKRPLKRHIRDKHRTEVPKKRHCPHCDFSCWSGPDLNAHLRTHLNNKHLQCPHCTFQFSKVATLQSHLRIHRNEQSFVCPYCGNVFAKYGVVKLHMEIHKDRSVFKCQQCEYETPSRRNLSVHRFRNHRAKEFSCSHCEYTTAVQLRYKMHLLSHKGDAAKLHACSSCEYKTKYLWDLKRHAQSRHNKQPSYPCPHCDFVAATLCILKKHASKHMEKLPPPDFLKVT